MSNRSVKYVFVAKCLEYVVVNLRLYLNCCLSNNLFVFNSDQSNEFLECFRNEITFLMKISTMNDESLLAITLPLHYTVSFFFTFFLFKGFNRFGDRTVIQQLLSKHQCTYSQFRCVIIFFKHSIRHI